MTESISLATGSVPRVVAPVAWQSRYARSVAVVDLAVVSIAILASTFIGRIDGAFGGQLLPGIPLEVAVAVAVGAVWMLLLTVNGTRSARIVGTGGAEYQRVFLSTFVVFGAAGLLAYLLGVPGMRLDLVAAAVIGTVGLTVGRWACRRWLVSRRRHGEMSNRVLLVGSRKSIETTIHDLIKTPQAGLHVVAACTTSKSAGGVVAGTDIPITGSFDRIAETMDAAGADTVVITNSNKLSPRAVRELSWKLEPGRKHLIVAPSLTDIGGPRLHTRPVAGLPLIHVETPRYEGGKLYVKRVFDVVVSALLLLLLAPVLAGLALVVRATSPGGAIYRQRRVGLRGTPFEMLKFRSMYTDAEERLQELLTAERGAGNGVLFKMKDDPRVTPVGKLLRRFSLDELPQLVNVLLGEMSLVGPRPPLQREVSLYTQHVHRRFLVKPGITGLWQVSGRSDLDWDESVRLDLYYVENWTLTGDLVILWKTARSVVASDGAY